MLTPHDCEKETAKLYWSLFGSVEKWLLQYHC